MKRLFVIFCIALPFCLGVWQIFRLDFKNELIERINQNMNREPFWVMENVTKKEEFVPVKFSCEYIRGKDLFLYNSSIYKGKTGFNLISPCKLEDGRTILVDRGFVMEQKSFSSEDDFVVGVIIFPRKASFFAPENDLKQNIWFNINISEVEKFFDIKLENFYVKMTKTSTDFPIREKFQPNIPNNHLGYAITWFSLAIAIFMISVRNRLMVEG